MITFENATYLVTGQQVWRYDTRMGQVTSHYITEVKTLLGNHESSGVTSGFLVTLDKDSTNIFVVMDPRFDDPDSSTSKDIYLQEKDVPIGTSEIDVLVGIWFARPLQEDNHDNQKGTPIP